MTIDNSKLPFANASYAVRDNNSQEDLAIEGSLKNHFLIAMPSLTDPYFEKSVVYLCEHDQQGAMGFIINYPVKLTVQELLKNAESIEHEPNPPLTDPVYLGGPLDMERGFVLHTPINDTSLSMPLNDQLMMSNSNVILSSLGTTEAPENYIVALGYSSWDAGQLEDEINKNQWLTINCENDIIFNTPVDQRWISSLKRLGVTPSQLSNDVGHS